MSNPDRTDASIQLHNKKELHAGHTSIIDPMECSISPRAFDRRTQFFERRTVCFDVAAHHFSYGKGNYAMQGFTSNIRQEILSYTKVCTFGDVPFS